MRWILILLLFSMPLIGGCATKQPVDMPLAKIEVKPAEEYKLDTSSIPEVKPPNMISLQQTASGYTVNEMMETPDALAIPASDIPSLVAILKVKNMYIDISKDQSVLINLERKKSQSYQELYSLERDARIIERELRNNIQELYKDERRSHRIDNVINRTTIIGLIIAGIGLGL